MVSATTKPPGIRLPPLLQQAVAAHQSGDLQAAAPDYRRFLEENPENPTALQLFGLLHSQLGDFETAITLMQKSLRLYPDQAEVSNNLGNALSSRGRHLEAIEAYSRAVAMIPRYADAWRNLALCLLDQRRLEEAENAFKQCLEIRPEDATAWLGAGNVHRQKQEFDAAVRCYKRALELQPNYAEAHHNLGVCLRLMRRPLEAVEQYRSARRLGLDRAELFHNLGSALVDAQAIGLAIESYREAVKRNPEDIISHRDLNKLLWEQELLDDHLESYRKALELRPDSARLRLAYAVALNQKEDFAEAERILVPGLKQTPGDIEMKSFLALTLERQQRWKEALSLHAAVVLAKGSGPNHLINYARALLACGRPDEALVRMRDAARQIPFNQRALAYLGLCWRMLGDVRDSILNDYENLVRVYDVPVPAGFANAREFNEALGACLRNLHVAKRHPPEQTLRGGTQTHGDLFDRGETEIQALVGGLNQCLNDYIGRLPATSDHPLHARRSEDFRYAASWSVNLRRGGYHTMHVHPLGWISSAYYVEVPDEISRPDAQDGGIKFGEPDIDLGSAGAARRRIQPATGRLVLFPSYMWHGTLPFESDTPRLTVAFDVIPGREPAP